MPVSVAQRDRGESVLLPLQAWFSRYLHHPFVPPVSTDRSVRSHAWHRYCIWLWSNLKHTFGMRNNHRQTSSLLNRRFDASKYSTDDRADRVDGNLTCDWLCPTSHDDSNRVDQHCTCVPVTDWCNRRFYHQQYWRRVDWDLNPSECSRHVHSDKIKPRFTLQLGLLRRYSTIW